MTNYKKEDETAYTIKCIPNNQEDRKDGKALQ